eukprot:237283-Pleurochrysis_carterae.AAC.2
MAMEAAAERAVGMTAAAAAAAVKAGREGSREAEVAAKAEVAATAKAEPRGVGDRVRVSRVGGAVPAGPAGGGKGGMAREEISGGVVGAVDGGGVPRIDFNRTVRPGGARFGIGRYAEEDEYCWPSSWREDEEGEDGGGDVGGAELGALGDRARGGGYAGENDGA